MWLARGRTLGFTHAANVEEAHNSDRATNREEVPEVRIARAWHKAQTSEAFAAPLA